MKIKKVTTGFVIQTYDTEKKKFVAQEFVASGECDYEKENGDEADSSLLNDANGDEMYLPFEMKQPNETK